MENGASDLSLQVAAAQNELISLTAGVAIKGRQQRVSSLTLQPEFGASVTNNTKGKVEIVSSFAGGVDSFLSTTTLHESTAGIHLAANFNSRSESFRGTAGLDFEFADGRSYRQAIYGKLMFLF